MNLASGDDAGFRSAPVRGAVFYISVLVAVSTLACRKDDPGPGDARTKTPASWFTDVTPRSGVAFTHQTGKRNTFDMPEIMGAGIALFDADGDQALDIYAINGAAVLGRASTDRTWRNRLFLRESNDRYRDDAGASGLGDPGYGMGCAVGDFDNDGDADVLVTNFGADALYLNRGDGVFEPAHRVAAVPRPAWSTSACVADFNLDGYLDLYIARYLDYDAAKRCTDRSGEPDYCGPQEFNGAPDVLLLNHTDGTFVDASESSGIDRFARKGLGLACLDVNGDARPDIYVANDGEPNLLWINRGDGTFADEATRRGAALNAEGRSEAGMGVAHGDVDGDGDVDLFVTNLWRESNTLYVNDGMGYFMDETVSAGLSAVSVAQTGFGAALFDIEHDGDIDLIVANGRVFSDAPLPGADDPYWRFYAEPDQVFLNDGRGHFEDAGRRGGALTCDVAVSRAVAPFDFDGDGDLDILISHCGGPLRLYRNDAPKRGGWLIVRAVDPALSRDAIGAVVLLEVGGRTLRRVVTRTCGYLTSGDAAVHFGLGDAPRIDSVTVVWPGGEAETFPASLPNRRVTLRKGSGSGP